MEALFLGFVVVLAMIVAALTAVYISRKTALFVAAGLSGWLLYVGLISYFGVAADSTNRPPGPIFVFAPVVLLLVFIIAKLRSINGTRIAMSFPLWVILCAQSFRIIVEVFLHQLWIQQLVPRMLTFEGANVDIYVGLSAPVIAWLATRRQSGLRWVLIWNLLGLCALLNVVVRAVLTAPGPLHILHTEVANQMIGRFPFTYIPGFFVPLAIVLHAVAIRIVTGPKGPDFQSAGSVR